MEELTERCEMSGTRPCLMGSSASSRWVQCVMARPFAHGSSQAEAMMAQAFSAL